MVLPTERELAAKLGMGPPAIRESIKALTILDVLESRRGDGTYVKSLEGRRKEWPTKFDVSTKDFSVLDLLEVRTMIEPKAANWEAAAEHDLLLHTAIIEAAGNEVLTELNSALTRLLHRNREISAARAHDCSQMLDSHSRIVDAILRGNGDEAEETMLDHLQRVGPDLISDRKR